MAHQWLQVKEAELSVATNPSVNNYNANSHPQAKVVFQALDNVAQVRRDKSLVKRKMPSPLQVNRPHHFSHPPYNITMKPMEPGAHF